MRSALDYGQITELPGSRASQEQLSRFYHRYRTAAPFCSTKDVLEVGCGGGQGLGYLASRASRIVGGDYTEENLKYARRHYGGRIALVGLDAHRLPFRDASFDVLISFETIYYLNSLEQFLNESRRVLRREGMLLISTVNTDWLDFHPSKYSARYLSVPQLAACLRGNHFEASFFGAYSSASSTMKGKMVSRIKRTAVRLHLIPGSLKYREKLKRVFMGRLETIPPELGEDHQEYIPPVPISSEISNSEYKIIYAIAHVR